MSCKSVLRNWLGIADIISDQENRFNKRIGIEVRKAQFSRDILAKKIIEIEAWAKASEAKIEELEFPGFNK